jgi:hypothetical protein
MVAGGAEEHARVYLPTWRGTGMRLAVTELAGGRSGRAVMPFVSDVR